MTALPWHVSQKTLAEKKETYSFPILSTVWCSMPGMETEKDVAIIYSKSISFIRKPSCLKHCFYQSQGFLDIFKRKSNLVMVSAGLACASRQRNLKWNKRAKTSCKHGRQDILVLTGVTTRWQERRTQSLTLVVILNLEV